MRLVRLGALCAVVWATLAPGAEVEVRSTTLLIAAPELTNPAQTTQTLVPIYERVGLSVRRISAPFIDDASFFLDGWASVLPTDGTLGGDVNVAYLDVLTAARHLRLRLGRQLITGGTARLMAIDGGMAEVSGLAGFGLSAFAGNPVARRFSNFTRGDFAAGGRVFWTPTVDAQVGVSFTHLTERGAVVRQDLGADARWHFLRAWTLAGAFLWSLPEQRLAECDVGVRWQPLTALEVAAGYRRTSPDLFLSRGSIFSVFAETTRDDVGLTVTASPFPWLMLVADGRALWMSQALGYDAGARAQLRLDRTSATTLTAQVRRLAVPANAYTQGRIGARHTLPFGLALSLDLDLYGLDVPVRGQTLSFSYSATATYAFNAQWLVGAALMGGSTPYFDRNTELMVKVSYAFPEGRR
jgi:hypothetical protein